MARISFDAPTGYRHGIPMFDERGKVTDRVKTGLENVLAAYVYIANYKAPRYDNNPRNYRVDKVFVVGSGARANRVDSDLDLLLIAPNLDEESAKQMKVHLAMIYFTDRPKTEAIDVFVRQKDVYLNRKSIDITSQVKDLLNCYNNKLSEG